MKQPMVAICCACVLAAASLSAAQADKKMDKMDKGKSVTVTGCVAEKDGHYMLNDAMMTGNTKSTTYDLMGGELKAHVGHKVEIMGDSKMDKSKMSKDKTSQDKMAMSDMHTAINVKSVKMISTTCP